MGSEKNRPIIINKYHQSIIERKKRRKNSGKIGKKKIFEIPFGFRTQREMRTLKRDEHKFGSFISTLFLIYPGP